MCTPRSNFGAANQAPRIGCTWGTGGGLEQHVPSYVPSFLHNSDFSDPHRTFGGVQWGRCLQNGTNQYKLKIPPPNSAGFHLPCSHPFHVHKKKNPYSSFIDSRTRNVIFCTQKNVCIANTKTGSWAEHSVGLGSACRLFIWEAQDFIL